MIEVGEVLTLDDNIEYAVTAVTILDNVEYVFLMDVEDNTNFMICSFNNNDELEEVEDFDLIQHLTKEFEAQLKHE